MKRVKETLNDGYMKYGTVVTVREEGKKVGTSFKEEGVLAFKLVTMREQDYVLEDVNTVQVDLKIKTMYPPTFRRKTKNKYKVLIEEDMYDVVRVDPDYRNNYLYFYLREVGDSYE